MTTPAEGGAGQVPPANGQQGGQVPPADAQTTGTQGGEQSGSGTQGGQQSGQAGGQVDLSTLPEAAQAYIAQLRGEAANHRTAAQAAAARLAAIDRANESAEEAATRERAELQAERDRLAQENRDLVVGTALTAAVDAAKAHNPATVLSLLAPKVELDAQGKPSNLDALVTALKASDPYLFRSTDAGAGAGTGTDSAPRTGGGMNDFIRGRGTAAAPR
jgi:hypothetical protein